MTACQIWVLLASYVFGFTMCNLKMGFLVLQVLASKSPGLLDFHEDLVSLEAASKVLILYSFLCYFSQCI